MGLLFSRNVPCKFSLLFLFSRRDSVDLFPQQLDIAGICSATTMVVVKLSGLCIPYRYKRKRRTKTKGTQKMELEVLVISAQNGNGMQFPKGGWETDESKEQAALRESIEEAGVVGNIESKLGKWFYKSKHQDTLHEGYMFPLLVKKQLENWPEKNIRERRWMTIADAKQACPHLWMKEALDVLVSRTFGLCKVIERKD
ncbi:Nudix hydrolase 18, mitochondrial, partial [Mucuna pruriens]